MSSTSSLTVIGYFVDPFVKRRIEFRYNMLFPLRAYKSQKNFRLVDRVLRYIVSEWGGKKDHTTERSLQSFYQQMKVCY